VEQLTDFSFVTMFVRVASARSFSAPSSAKVQARYRLSTTLNANKATDAVTIKFEVSRFFYDLI
jgi:hypothetical protein